MRHAAVSLIIVSHQRPAHLLSVLQSLGHQTHPNFEVVVVADELPSPFVNRVKFIRFEDANISAARNIAIAHSNGDLLAFCDDDAVPDPPWLERLVAPFTNPNVGATTGFTRGRNGISRQWGAMRFDTSGRDHPFDIDEADPFTFFDPSSTMPVKLIGTTMAFRKSALQEIGSFDENFYFFLDETDAKLRLDMAGWTSAIVPRAQVHHRFASSSRRAENRAPIDLFEIGASKAYFCKIHSPESLDRSLREFTKAQLTRMTTMVKQHKLRRPEVTPLMETLARGIEDGLARERTTQEPSSEQTDFLKFDTHDGEHLLICAGPRDSAWSQSAAQEAVAAGKCVSVIQLLRSVRYFQVEFKDGYWLHRGGLFGRSTRTQPILQFGSYRRRFSTEIGRISAIHPVDTILTNPDRRIKL